MLPHAFPSLARSLGRALAVVIPLVVLPHCANGDGGRTSTELPDDGESAKLESPSTSTPSTEPAPASTASATTSSPADAGAVSDAAPVDAGCTASSECAPVPCTCKLGKVELEGRLCTAGVCATAPKDVCPTACGLLGGWAGP